MSTSAKSSRATSTATTSTIRHVRHGLGAGGNQHRSPGLVRGREGRENCGNGRIREKGRKQDLFPFQLNEETYVVVPDEPEALRLQYTKLEGDLRHWSRKINDLDTPDKTLDAWERILPHIKRLMQVATALFTKDIKYYLKMEMDVRVWKYGVYQFINLLRNVSSEKRDVSVVAFVELCHRGIQHFKYFLINASKILQVKLEPIFDSSGCLRDSSKKENLTENELLCYRLFVVIGDLYRYLFERCRITRDAHMANNMYTAARLCDTTKSRGYHQLAILNKAQGDVFGTIYNYTRAYRASPPIDGITSQLNFIYDDIYKQFCTVRWSFWYTWMKRVENSLPFIRPCKQERWLMPTRNLEKCVRPIMQLPPKRTNYLASLANFGVVQRFSLAYTHFMGMLFTKIGTESLEDVGKEVVICFEALLSKDETEFNFVLEIIALALYMTDFLTPPSSEKKYDLEMQAAISQIKYMRGVVIEVTVNMLIMVCEKTLRTIKLLDWDNQWVTIGGAAIHVWCLWARRRPYFIKTWKKGSDTFENISRQGEEEYFERLHFVKFAVSFCRLTTELSTLLQKHSEMIFPKINLGPTEACTRTISAFPELLLLDGFAEVILPQDFQLSKYLHDGRFGKDRLHTHFRFIRIAKFGSKMFPEMKKHKKVFNTRNNWNTEKHPIDMVLEEECQVIQWIHDTQGKPVRSEISRLEYKQKISRPDCNNARIILKSKTRRTLNATETRKLKFKAPPITKVHEMWMDLAVKGVRVELFVRPVHIMLDTNCLIRQLNEVKRILDMVENPIIIPSTVLHELRGLAKGAKTGYSPRISQKLTPDEKKLRIIEVMEVGEQCFTALKFLDGNKTKFRVVTISGKEIKMYNYLRQKVYDDWCNPDQPNDERILETCSYLVLKDIESRKHDTPMRLFRNMVLLTGDKSLRVRAYAMDIPSRSIRSFIKWLQEALVSNGVYNVAKIFRGPRMAYPASLPPRKLKRKYQRTSKCASF